MIKTYRLLKGKARSIGFIKSPNKSLTDKNLVIPVN